MSPTDPAFELTASRGFPEWLLSQGLSLVFTTYQAGKVFFLGVNSADGRLSIFERTLDRAMGLAVDGQDIHMSTLWQVWRFRNVLEPGQNYQGYDRVYLPRQSWVTGDLDIHDMAVEDSGRLVFATTLFNCLGTLDEDQNFLMIWKPPWISAMLPEDRCHLNGVAIRDGKARYATAVSRSDVCDGWRDRRLASGVVIDIETNDVLCEGLSMPHSPRYHDGCLYAINSGTGFLGRVDEEKRAFVPITFLPGYARGLAMTGGHAVVGLSDRRENRTFQDLPLEEELRKRDADTRCGIQVVDLRSGAVVEWVRIRGVVRELYDIAVIPGALRPMAVGFLGEEVKRMISFR